jgi:hypothetical protein
VVAKADENDERREPSVIARLRTLTTVDPSAYDAAAVVAVS